MKIYKRFVKAGEFRADLLDRLAFDVITLSPLCHRGDDVLLLAESFAVDMPSQLGIECFAGFGKKMNKLLLDYHLPGNVRELKNVIERSVYRNSADDKVIDEIILDPFESPFRSCDRVKATDQVQAVTSALTQDQQIESSISLESLLHFPIDFKMHCEATETNIIKQALLTVRFNQKKSADLLSLSYHQLRCLLKK